MGGDVRRPEHARSGSSARFLSLREGDLALIQDTKPHAKKNKVTHPERGAMTFRVIVETMAGHDLNHIAQLDAIVAGFAK